MSNIRTLNDFNRQTTGSPQVINDHAPPISRRAQQYQMQQFEIEEGQQPQHHHNAYQNDNPSFCSRAGKCLSNCWFLIFPNFAFKTVTCAYAFFITFVFIVTCIVYGANQVPFMCVLYNGGAKYTYAISRKGHIHRLLLPIILHASFFHLFWNVLSLMFIGFSIEKALGKWYKYLALIIFGGRETFLGPKVFAADSRRVLFQQAPLTSSSTKIQRQMILQWLAPQLKQHLISQMACLGAQSLESSIDFCRTWPLNPQYPAFPDIIIPLPIFGGIGGNIFSAVVSPYTIAVGSSTSLYAIIGALGLWYYRHWGQLGPQRTQYAIFIVIMLIFSFINGLAMANSGVDSWGHLGGLLFGLFISAILFQTTNNQEQPPEPSQNAQNHIKSKRRRIIVGSAAVLAIMTVVLGVALFARPLPMCERYDCAHVCE